MNSDKTTGVNKRKLYLGIGFLVVAIICLALIFVLPDKQVEKKDQVSKEKYVFTQQGMASFFDKEGKQKCRFIIEIADTPEKQKQGLMYRESMYDYQAMLFVNDKADNQSFWMKNTYLPLDIIFIGSDSTIVSISENTTPFSEEKLLSEGPAQFVMEVNAGQASVNNLKKGDKFIWKKG